jgi:hypothetical protein
MRAVYLATKEHKVNKVKFNRLNHFYTPPYFYLNHHAAKPGGTAPPVSARRQK